ncbi:MAG TPA: 4-(cytidine 5'-diphospho)-2-C-methyl-D-erythritol kinase [Gammaproteobacteria bacterium]|nr:4-(cytidine 5'-diphospho)-2-C-methyl-D-erythritol kinase [Gammaproteobacteria bacterium]
MSTSDPLPAGLPVWPAPAKLNLFLHIVGRRADGYHELQTVFQLLEFGDRLAFEPTGDGEIHRVTAVEGVSEADDLVVKAARLLRDSAGVRRGVRIHLDKRLPMGGGLGGGSSDAATTLVALNQLWEAGLERDELMALGLRLGADVPVFVNARNAWAEGVGERLEAIVLPEAWYLVVAPGVHVSTPKLFSDPELTRDCPAITIRDFLGGAGQNVFEPLVKKKYPPVAAAMKWLDQFAEAKLTGTGGCVFGAFASEREARDALRRLPGEFEGFVSRGSPAANGP